MEPRGGGVGRAGGAAGEEDGLREVELDGDGLHPTRVPLGRGGVVLEEAHGRRVALERLGHEGIHLRRDHAAAPTRAPPTPSSPDETTRAPPTPVARGPDCFLLFLSRDFCVNFWIYL